MLVAHLTEPRGVSFAAPFGARLGLSVDPFKFHGRQFRVRVLSGLRDRTGKFLDQNANGVGGENLQDDFQFVFTTAPRPGPTAGTSLLTSSLLPGWLSSLLLPSGGK